MNDAWVANRSLSLNRHHFDGRRNARAAEGKRLCRAHGRRRRGRFPRTYLRRAGLLRESLEGPRAKLDRAAEHLTPLDAETAAFFEFESYEVESKFQADVSEYVFKIKIGYRLW